MRIVRNLCLYRRRTESSCYVPDTELFPANHQPTPPHIFTKPQIVRLLEETDRLYSVSHAPLRVPAIRMAVVLLYTTGVRLGELLRLELADYDATERVLHVRASKFHKSRYVPVSCDTAAEIGRYLQIRQQLRLPVASEKKLLWHGSAQGDGYGKGRLRFTMHTLFRLAETQTVHALLRWYEEGIDVQAKLPLLATYMGHVSIVSTQRYLHFIEPLASASSMRFATRCAALVETVASRRGGTR